MLWRGGRHQPGEGKKQVVVMVVHRKERWHPQVTMYAAASGSACLVCF